MNTVQVIVVCVTLFLIVLSICIAVCVFNEQDNKYRYDKNSNGELRRMQEQCNSMYAMYVNIKDDVHHIKKKLK